MELARTRTPRDYIFYHDEQSYKTWKQIFEFLKDQENMLGDLSREMLRKPHKIDERSEEEIKLYMTELAIKHPIMDEAVRRMKTVYATIYNSITHNK